MNTVSDYDYINHPHYFSVLNMVPLKVKEKQEWSLLCVSNCICCNFMCEVLDWHCDSKINDNISEEWLSCAIIINKVLWNNHAG